MNIAPQRGLVKRPDPARARHSSLDADLKPDSYITREGTDFEPDTRLAMIAEAAYYLAEQRGFDPGHEIQDWLDAEAAIDAVIQRGHSPED